MNIRKTHIKKFKDYWVRDIPEKIYNKIKNSAKLKHSSINRYYLELILLGYEAQRQGYTIFDKIPKKVNNNVY